MLLNIFSRQNDVRIEVEESKEINEEGTMSGKVNTSSQRPPKQPLNRQDKIERNLHLLDEGVAVVRRVTI
jgi:hypothetical protein